jgi:hypothetical protein
VDGFVNKINIVIRAAFHTNVVYIIETLELLHFRNPIANKQCLPDFQNTIILWDAPHRRTRILSSPASGEALNTPKTAIIKPLLLSATETMIFVEFSLVYSR